MYQVLPPSRGESRRSGDTVTSTETIAAIHDSLHADGDLHCTCGEVPICEGCTIAWLLQENESLISQFNVSVGMRETLSEEVVRLRGEIARIDAVRMESYLASRKR